jgi:hypothetical protein
VVIVKELLGLLGAKALTHTHRILRHAYYVKQRMAAEAHGSQVVSRAVLGIAAIELLPTIRAKLYVILSSHNLGGVA